MLAVEKSLVSLAAVAAVNFRNGLERGTLLIKQLPPLTLDKWDELRKLLQFRSSSAPCEKFVDWIIGQ